MSVIAFRKLQDKIQIGADGLAVSGDIIRDTKFKKIRKISDEIIIGATGVNECIEMFALFTHDNRSAMANIKSLTDYISVLKEFREYISNTYGYTDGTIKEDFGGLLFVNRHFHGVGYYDNNLSPYVAYSNEDTFAFGITGIYTSALLDCGFSIEDAIKKTAEKYTTINDNVTILELNLD